MKLKYTFEAMEMDGKTVAVPIGANSDEFHGLVKLNETGAAVFELLKEDITEDALIAALAEKFNAPLCDVAACVKPFIKKMKSEGIVE